MNKNDLANIEPFEICSIRPPTENSSLTIRLTRNCYWNKCEFCPVYKTGVKYSKRSFEDIEKDILHAKKIDELLEKEGVYNLPYSQGQTLLYSLIEEVKQARFDAGLIPTLDEKNNDLIDSPNLDERMRWLLSWLKDKPITEDSFTHVYMWRMTGGKTCFLGDADSLILKPDIINKTTSLVKKTFPSIDRFTIYGRTKSASKLRTLDELKEYTKAGINRVHFGLESGDDRVLELVKKGETAEDHKNGILKVKEAGMSASVYIMPGLGGSKLSESNSIETAKLLNIVASDYVRIRTLEVFPATGLGSMKRNGSFVEASEEEVVKEIRVIIANTLCETEIVSDSAANLLNINGKLPYERDNMLFEIDSYLELSKRQKLEFSLRSRLNSFTGQYGGLTEDIYSMLSPYMKNDKLDISKANDKSLSQIISLICGKLMP